MKKAYRFLFVLTLCICFPILSQAQQEEQIRLITYYPAPYGVYKSLTVQDVGITPIDLLTLYQDTTEEFYTEAGIYTMGPTIRFRQKVNVDSLDEITVARISGGYPNSGQGALYFETCDFDSSTYNSTIPQMVLINDRVGIGSRIPAAILDIGGTNEMEMTDTANIAVLIRPTLTAVSDYETLTGLHINPTFTRSYSSESTDTDTYYSSSESSYTDTTDTTMRKNGLIVERGRTGLGTTEPDCQLQVESEGVGDEFRIAEFRQSQETNANASIKITGANTATTADIAAINFSNSVPETVFPLSRISSGLYNADEKSGFLRFYTYNEEITGTDKMKERMRIMHDGSVGIGTTNPSCLFQVTGTGLDNRLAEFQQPTDVTADASIKIRGSRNTADNYDIASINLNNYDSDESGGTDFTMGRIAAGMNASDDQVGYLRFYTNSSADLSEKMRITAGGNVGIGTTTPGFLLHADGSVGFPRLIKRSISWSVYKDDNFVMIDKNTGELFRGPTIEEVQKQDLGRSSERYKKEITDIEINTKETYNLRPASFTWKDSEKRDFGLIAEEVAEVIPSLATYNKEDQPEGVRYKLLAVLLLNELKEMNNKMQQLEERISQLEEK